MLLCRRFLFAIFFLSTVAPAAFSQDALPSIYVRLYDHVASFSAPPWIISRAQAGQFEMSRQQSKLPSGADVFLVEYILQGEAFDNWTQLYAIQAIKPAKRTAQAARASTLVQYTQSCEHVESEKANTGLPETTAFVIFCNSYIDDPAMGEIAVLNYQRHTTTSVQNYYHWRTPAFDFPYGKEKAAIFNQIVSSGFKAVTALDVAICTN